MTNLEILEELCHMFDNDKTMTIVQDVDGVKFEWTMEELLKCALPSVVFATASQ